MVVGTGGVCRRSTWSAWMVHGGRSAAWMVLGRRRLTRSARIPLRRGRVVTCLTGDGGGVCWCGVCRAHTHPSGGYAESGRDGGPSHQLLHVHVRHLSCNSRCSSSRLEVSCHISDLSVEPLVGP
jgi:hypothetical protein